MILDCLNTHKYL